MPGKLCRNPGDGLLRYGPRDQQGLHSAAGAITLGFGIDHDGYCLLKIRSVINIHVTVAVKMLDDRHLCVGTDSLDQTLATTRHDDINKLRHSNQLGHRVPVRAINYLNDIYVQPGGRQTFPDARSDRLIGQQRLRAPSEDGSVAGLETEAGRFTGHIRP